MSKTIVSGKLVPVPTSVLHIDGLLQLQCCGIVLGSPDVDTDIAAASGGAQLAKLACDGCGAEYLVGVIARTKEESLASEVFDEVSAEQLAEIGVDTNAASTYVEPTGGDDIKMCAKCDGDARPSDYCAGCREYVCSGCREYNPVRPQRHAVEDHWTEPDKQSALGGGASSVADAADDGSTFDFDEE